MKLQKSMALNRLKRNHLSGRRFFAMRKKVYTGKGIGVAVLDTGIFPHIDFGSRIRILQKEKQDLMMIMDMEPT